LKTDDLPIYFQSLRIVDKNSYDNRIPEERLNDMYEKMYYGFVEKKINNSYRQTVYDFIERLNQTKNTCFTHPCLAFSKKHLSIDFAGNIMSCCAFDKGSKCGNVDLRLGNIKETKLTNDIKNIYYPTIEERKKRLNCNDCLFKHMCSSGCSLNDSNEYEIDNCKQNYYYNLALFLITLSMITGKIVKEIIKEKKGG